MFNFLRNITKSAEEKRQETVAAYLDGMLSDRERLRFEQEMGQDSGLRTQVDQLRLVKQSLRHLPQRPVPRNFILDPAQYGRPARQPWVQVYPVLRTATALAAFYLLTSEGKICCYRCCCNSDSCTARCKCRSQ